MPLIVSASLGGSDSSGGHVFMGFLGSLAGFPTVGDSFAVISTGNAENTILPDDSGSLSTVLGGLNNGSGE